MVYALTAGGLLVAAGHLALLLACWKTRSVLAGILAGLGLALVAFAIVSGPTRPDGECALLIAAIALLVGTTLYIIGQALARLLDGEPDDPN